MTVSVPFSKGLVLHRRKKLYVDHNSLLQVVQEINRRATGARVTRKGVTHGGNLFTKGASSVC
jgi:hypothetical protein